jgi:RNA polymerase sigma-70 factor (ECF subfamily)
LAARDAPTSEAREALEDLCRAYWYPLYAFVRRLGEGPDDARDITQAYFTRLLEKGYLDDYDPDRGRFRVFLMASIRNFLSKERKRAQALKRGGGAEILSLDERDAEGRYSHEPAEPLTPEQVFERRWALTLLERVLVRLQAELAAAGRGREFERLRGFLTGEQPKLAYRDVGAELGLSEAAVKTAVHRLRQRFGALLREEIAGTVAGPHEVDDEVRHLLAVAPWGPPVVNAR